MMISGLVPRPKGSVPQMPLHLFNGFCIDARLEIESRPPRCDSIENRMKNPL
jgi:hypothetical protein